MRVNAFTCAIALAICTGLAACGNDADRDMAKDLSRANPPPQPTTRAPASTASNTPTTPANAGTPSAAEKHEGSNPQQGQVDPKQPEQRKDFQKN
jgi:hypothetical protein